jgi:hypothetical protein
MNEALAVPQEICAKREGVVMVTLRVRGSGEREDGSAGERAGADEAADAGDET